MSEAKQQKEESSNKIFIGNLPFNLTEDQMKEKFNKVGEVKDAFLFKYREKSKGYGFLTYENNDIAKNAVNEFNNFTFEGRVLNAEIARPDSENIKKRSHRNYGRDRGRYRGSNKGRFRKIFNKKNNKEVKDEKKEENSDSDIKIKGSSLLEPRKYDFDEKEGDEIDFNETEDIIIDDKKKDSQYNNVKDSGKKGARRGRGRGRGRGNTRYYTYNGKRSNFKYDESRMSKNTVCLLNLSYSLFKEEQLIEKLPETYKDKIEHIKIVKEAKLKSRSVSSLQTPEEEVEMSSKGFAFIQFKSDELCSEFFKKYGVQSRSKEGYEPIEIEGRKLVVLKAKNNLVTQTK